MYDIDWMKIALAEARKALVLDEVPVGAIVVRKGMIIGNGFNLINTLNDSMQHAELIALQSAKRNIESKYLLDSTIYVTLEPCPMCMGAIINSRIKRLVYATNDEKMGACGSIVDLPRIENFNHKVDIDYGILASESSQLLKDFFKQKR